MEFDSPIPTRVFHILLTLNFSIMEKLKFRTLNADEIECRVGTVTDKGVSLLMYKNARVDMTLLDEVVGPENWKREHTLINGNLFCTVSVRTSKGDWVSKQDVGTESNTEKEKGQASDAFKRACVNWGIGRELYTCPFVWVNLRAEEWRVGYNGKKQPKTRFYVTNIEYDDQRRVSYLRIVDDSGQQRYVFGKSVELAKEKAGLIEHIKKAENRKELEDIYKGAGELRQDTDVLRACSEKAQELKQETAA